MDEVGMLCDKEEDEDPRVRCGTLKEAELIPDSAVPYTLPESRCKSSNRQMSGGGRGLRERYRRERRCRGGAYGSRSSQRRESSGGGGGVNRRWLVREEERKPQRAGVHAANLCTWVRVHTRTVSVVAAEVRAPVDGGQETRVSGGGVQ